VEGVSVELMLLSAFSKKNKRDSADQGARGCCMSGSRNYYILHGCPKRTCVMRGQIRITYM